MNIISENIKHLRKLKNLTQSDLADKLAINRAMIGSYEEGRAIPKLEVLRTISAYFNVFIDDLLNKDLRETDNNNPDQKVDIKGTSLRVLSTIVDKDNKEMITAIPAKAAAGYLNGYADPEYIESLPSFSLPLPEMSNERTYRSFQIKGDSMEPIPSGSYIIAEYVQNWQDIKDGKTYVLVTKSDGIVFKRINNRIDESGELILKSDNPAYEPYNIKTSDIIDVWKATGYICFDMPQPDEPNLHKLSSEITKMKEELERLKKL